MKFFTVAETLDEKGDYKQSIKCFQYALAQALNDDFEFTLPIVKSQYKRAGCQKIIENCPSFAENFDVEYEDIFADVQCQLKATRMCLTQNLFFMKN